MKSKSFYWEKDLRKVIKSWDFIPGSPSDEFNTLNHKILNHINSGADKDKIFNVIRSELITYYGLSPNDNDIEQITEEILSWWSNQ